MTYRRSDAQRSRSRFLPGCRERLPAVPAGGQPGNHLVEQIADPVACSAAISTTGSKPELVELRRSPARPLVVGLVDGQQHRERSPSARRVGNFLVAGQQPLAPVHQENNDLCLIRARADPPRRPARASGSSLAPNIPPVSTSVNVTPCHSAGCEITSRVVPAIGCHDRTPRVRDSVEKRGFSDVWASHQHDGWRRRRAFVCHSEI